MSRSVCAPWICVLAMMSVLGLTRPANGQELEARSYSASPIDTNFAVLLFSDSNGTVPLDPSLPLSDVHASIDAANLSFSHTFPLAGLTASWAILVPYLEAHVNGSYNAEPGAITRYGFPDLRVRFAVNLLGPALTPREFAHRKPKTSLGLSVTVIAPTGTYDPTHLLNIGSNRWTLKPEIGLEQPMGKWFTDLSAGLWIFGQNNNYFQNSVLRQAPLDIYQIHFGYNFRPGQWLALDGNYYSGGATSVNGAAAINALANSRYGLTFSQPLGPSLSAKLSWSQWLNGKFGQNFSTVYIAFQYRWFNR